MRARPHWPPQRDANSRWRLCRPPRGPRRRRAVAVEAAADGRRVHGEQVRQQAPQQCRLVPAAVVGCGGGLVPSQRRRASARRQQRARGASAARDQHQDGRRSELPARRHRRIDGACPHDRLDERTLLEAVVWRGEAAGVSGGGGGGCCDGSRQGRQQLGGHRRNGGGGGARAARVAMATSAASACALIIAAALPGPPNESVPRATSAPAPASAPVGVAGRVSAASGSQPRRGRPHPAHRGGQRRRRRG